MAEPDRISDYEVTGVLGRGGMGVVYEAVHAHSRARAAVKTVRVATGSTIESIRREILMLRELQHPGVVSIVDHGVADGMPWYAMELLRGRTLRDDLRAWFPEAGDAPREAPPWSVAHVATVFRRLCEPLAYVHGQGVVHSDLSAGEHVPARRPPAGAVRLRARGAAIEPSGAAREILEVGAAVRGTAHYMAPEQARGEAVDARADIYALGCMLYEALCGRPPFLGDSAAAVLMQHVVRRRRCRRARLGPRAGGARRARAADAREVAARPHRVRRGRRERARGRGRAGRSTFALPFGSAARPGGAGACGGGGGRARLGAAAARVHVPAGPRGARRPRRDPRRPARRAGRRARRLRVPRRRERRRQDAARGGDRGARGGARRADHRRRVRAARAGRCTRCARCCARRRSRARPAGAPRRCGCSARAGGLLAAVRAGARRARRADRATRRCRRRRRASACSRCCATWSSRSPPTIRCCSCSTTCSGPTS